MSERYAGLPYRTAGLAAPALHLQ
jgi:hypothetical protein